MIIISCKWIKESKLLDLLDSIKKYQPEEKIVVVDSDSEDKSYFEKIKDLCIIEDISNKNYLEGALWYSLEKYKDENFFYLLQDSMVLKSSLENFKSKDISYLVYFNFHYNPIYGHDSMRRFSSEELLTKTTYEFKEPKWAVFGSCIFASRNFLEKVKSNGFDKILPKNKMEMESMERLWAFVIEQEGYNLEEVGDTINTEFSKNKYIEKFWLNRQ